MAFKKDTKIKNNFTKITISLASPEEILENSLVRLQSLRPLTIVHINQNVTVYSANASSVLQKITSVLAVNINVFVIKVSCATDAVSR